MKTTIKFGCLAVLMMLFACETYLAEKTDKKLSVPQTIGDLQAVLDHVERMNSGGARGLGVAASDDLFMHEADWAARAEMYRMEYIWDKVPVDKIYWNIPYRAILAANTVIDYLPTIPAAQADKKRILGSALFFRGYWFFDLAQTFAPPYDEHTAGRKMGVVLRLSADVNVKSERADLAETYRQIIADLKAAANLLPDHRMVYPTRPNRAAAFGALARCYLAMRDYTNALKYADSCLQIHGTLLDYNLIEKEGDYPFERFNEEVIFYSEIVAQGNLAQNVARVDTTLYGMFEDDDLRKHLFFSVEADGYHSFTGDYGENSSVAKFGGVTSAEMLLIRMECYARAGDLESGLEDLNKLLKHRYADEGRVPLVELDSAGLLAHILEERRKELLFRGTRWSDIRRFAFEPGQSVSLQRMLGDQVYTLTADDQKEFAFFIPEETITISGIPQNK